MVAAGACVPDRPVRSRLDAFLLDAPCAAESRAAVVAWGARGDGIGAPPAPGVASTARFPTAEPGVWVVVERGVSGAAVAVHRVDASGTRTLTFDARCTATERTVPGPSAGVAASSPSGPGGTFTDADLRSLLAASDGVPVVVYLWSPHMPLSVDGWREIEAAAASLGMTAVPVLIAHAEADFARREAARAGIPPEGLRSVASVELLMRDAQVHAPSILIFGADRVSPVLPGYRNAEGYGRFLEAFLGRGA